MLNSQSGLMNCKNNLNRMGVVLLVMILLSSFGFVLATTKNVNDVLVKEQTTDTGKVITTNMKKMVTKVSRTSRTSKVTIVNQEASNPVDGGKQTLKEKIKEYRTILNIPKYKSVNVKVVIKLIKRKVTNYNNFQRIVNVTKVVSDAKDKEIITKELLDMDEKFIDRFTENTMRNRPEVKKQIVNYIRLVRMKRKIRVRIDENRVRDLFEKKITRDEFIDWIWENI